MKILDQMAKCRSCKQPLLHPADRKLGQCAVCYPPHAGPTCRKGLCLPMLEQALVMDMRPFNPARVGRRAA